MGKKINKNDYNKFYKKRIHDLNSEFEFIKIVELRNNPYNHLIRIRHKICGDTMDICLGNFMKTRHCVYCSGIKINHRVFLERFKNIRSDYDEYEILSKYERMDKPILLKHKPCGNIYYKTPCSLIYTKDKCFCKYGRYTNKHTFKLLYEHIKSIDENYTLISGPDKQYIHCSKDKVTIRHDICGTEFETLPHSFITIGTRCPTCTNNKLNRDDSIGVKYIEQWLRERKLYYEREKTFETLVSPITNRKLRCDFYVPDMNTVIEYDGKQHFDIHTNSIFTQEKYNRIHLYDNVKNAWCHYNNINILRINYKQSEKDIIYSILDNWLYNHCTIYISQKY